MQGQQLEYLLLHLYEEMQHDNSLATVLFGHRPSAAELAELQRVVARLQAMRNLTERGVVPSRGLKGDLQLVDGHLLQQVRDGAPANSVGIIRELLVSRAGDFSCPLQCAVVFVANVPADVCAALGRDPHAYMEALEHLASGPTCAAFDGLITMQALLQESQTGSIPPLIDRTWGDTADWGEFDPEWATGGDPAEAQPLPQQQQEGPGGSSNGTPLRSAGGSSSGSSCRAGQGPSCSKAGLEAREADAASAAALAAATSLVLRPVAWMRFLTRREHACRQRAWRDEAFHGGIAKAGEGSGSSGGADMGGGASQQCDIGLHLSGGAGDGAGAAVEAAAGAGNAVLPLLPQGLPEADQHLLEHEQAQLAQEAALDAPNFFMGAAAAAAHAAHVALEAGQHAAAAALAAIGMAAPGPQQQLQGPGPVQADGAVHEEDQDGALPEDANDAFQAAAQAAAQAWAAAAGQAVPGRRQAPASFELKGHLAEAAEAAMHAGAGAEAWHPAQEPHNDAANADSDGEDEEPEGWPGVWMPYRGTDFRDKLHIRLSRCHAGNLMMVKLINPENQLARWHDPHGAPNIDLSYVQAKGTLVNLSDWPGARLSLS